MVESYNYDATDLGTDALQAATDDAGGIRPDGTPKTGTVSWPGPVHFFRSERVLVLYVGGDADVVVADRLARSAVRRPVTAPTTGRPSGRVEARETSLQTVCWRMSNVDLFLRVGVRRPGVPVAGKVDRGLAMVGSGIPFRVREQVAGSCPVADLNFPYLIR